MSLWGNDSKTPDKSTDTSSTANTAQPAVAQTSQSLSRSAAMIGQSIVIKGTIQGAENLVIEGTVEGSVSLPEHDLTVGQSGKVTADLHANTVKIDGTVQGDVSAKEKVIISKSGHVRGNIIAPRVTLEDGAKFKGSIDMDPVEVKPIGKAEPKATPNNNAGPASTKEAS